MKTVEKIDRTVTNLARITSVIAYVGYALMILITVCDVILRYVINKPILGSYELVQYLLLMSVFASFAYCQVLHGHIQVTMLLRVLPKRAIFVVYTLTSVLTCGIMALLAYAAGQQALYAMAKGYVSDALKLPVAPFIWVECGCMIVFALSILPDIIHSAIAVWNGEIREKMYQELF